MTTSCSRRLSFRLAFALALAFSLAVATRPRPQRADNQQVSSTSAVPAEVPGAAREETEERARNAYGKLGVSFEENRGQVGGQVRYLARHGGATVFLTNNEAAFTLSAATRQEPESHAVSMKFEGANTAAEVSGERELEGKVNYLRGSDPSKWQTNVRTYGAVRYRGIYDGVDLVYYGKRQGQMEYDFEVSPGADAGRISLKIEGAKALKVDAAGDLLISTPAGEMRQRRPLVYQEVEGARREVEGGYALEAGGRVRFKLGQYDDSAPLIIDPVLEYSTYLRGHYQDYGYAVAADSAGNAYVIGSTFSQHFPMVNPIQPGGSGVPTAFVVKIGYRSISGRVVTRGAAGVAGVPWVTVKLTGAQTLTGLTDAHGYYSFADVDPRGGHVITPSKTNLSFAPASRTYADLNADLSDVNFTVPSLSVGNVAVTEGDTGESAANFTVKLQPPSTQPVTVNYQTAGGTISPAAADSDYTALPLTQLTFAPGQTVKAVTVKVRGDTLDEADETFRLLLSAPTGALISNKEGVCVITDNDAAPSLKVDNVAVTEGDADVTATFTVSLSAQSAQTLTVKYKTANGTATAPADYTGVGLTTLTFAPGETTKTVSVTVKGDESDEPAETFRLQLSSPANATIADGTGICTITDDD